MKEFKLNEMQIKLSISKQPIMYVVKWIAKSIFAKKIKASDVEEINVDWLREEEGDYVVWLGHASFLLQLDGIKIITDPVLYNIPFAERLTKLPIDAGQLIPDIVLVSHAHRDHLDIRSLNTINKNNPRTKYIVPLGVKSIMSESMRANTVELDWGESIFYGGIVFNAVPSSHWHARGVGDFNKALWCSYVMESKKQTIFFAGDSAYNSHFKEIKKIYGFFDLALMPIGAYEPASIMSGSHMNPEEAVCASRDLNSNKMIAYHYSTFKLSDEGIGEPLAWLKELKLENNALIDMLDVGRVWSNFKTKD